VIMANTTADCIGMIEPPPGVTPNFANPTSLLKSHIAIHTVFLGLGTICLAMRLYTRKFIHRKLALDDCKLGAIPTPGRDESMLIPPRCSHTFLREYKSTEYCVAKRIHREFSISMKDWRISRWKYGSDLLTISFSVGFRPLRLKLTSHLVRAVSGGVMCSSQRIL